MISQLFLNKKFKISILVFVLLIFLGFCSYVAYNKFFKVIRSEQNQAQETIFQPEIPVNQFWDWGKFNNSNLYVNNTDKNIIYALADTGKIIWKIEGSNYGIEKFEFTKKQDKLLIKDNYYDEMKVYWSSLFVFDGAGSLVWKHDFKGYLDWPQLKLFGDDYLIALNTTDNKCNHGCGVLCDKDLENNCFENGLWAFDFNTGKIIWRNNTVNFYGRYYGADKNGDIMIGSGGVGFGNYKNDYLIDIKTGEIERNTARVNYGNTTSGDKSKLLIFDMNPKKLFFIDVSDEESGWELSEADVLYKFVFSHLNGEFRIVIYEDSIIAYNKVKNNQVSVYAWSVEDGHLLWQKDYILGNYFFDLNNSIEKDGKILLNLSYLSTCDNFCQECAEGSFVCLDKSSDKECKSCKLKEKETPDYSAIKIWQLDEKTGEINWQKDKYYLGGGIDENGVIEAVGEDNKTKIKLDFNTGKQIK